MHIFEQQGVHCQENRPSKSLSTDQAEGGPLARVTFGFGFGFGGGLASV